MKKFFTIHKLDVGSEAYRDEYVTALEQIAQAAVRSVHNPAWAGVCDEDVLLEATLRKHGFLNDKTGLPTPAKFQQRIAKKGN